MAVPTGRPAALTMDIAFGDAHSWSCRSAQPLQQRALVKP